MHWYTRSRQTGGVNANIEGGKGGGGGTHTHILTHTHTHTHTHTQPQSLSRSSCVALDCLGHVYIHTGGEKHTQTEELTEKRIDRQIDEERGVGGGGAGQITERHKQKMEASCNAPAQGYAEVQHIF